MNETVNPAGNVDAAEVARFQSAASRWWDPEGEMRPLHDLNPLRLSYVERSGPLAGRAVVDVGCGKGDLLKLICRLGENRGHGFDVSYDGDPNPADAPGVIAVGSVGVVSPADTMAPALAASSSRGPTADGRIKPDLVAPGTNIVSVRSQALDASADGWGAYGPIPDKYMFDGGTSMATPLTTERYTASYRGLQAWGASEAVSPIAKGFTRTLPGLAGFHMAGQWGEATVGISTAATAGRRVVQQLCRQDGRRCRSG